MCTKDKKNQTLRNEKEQNEINHCFSVERAYGNILHIHPFRTKAAKCSLGDQCLINEK